MIRLFRWAIVGIALVCLSCSGSSDLKTKTLSMFEAINRHDVTAALSFFAEDVDYQMPNEPLITGKVALRKVFEWDSTLSTTAEIGGLSAVGDTVLVDSFVESNQFMKLLGVNGIGSVPGTRFIFENDLIKRVEFSENDQGGTRLLRARFSAFMSWLLNTHPERTNIVRDRSFFRQDRARASDWMQLAVEYKEWRSARGMLN